MTLDLTLSPLYRINGQEIASLPGLLVQYPPRNPARGREQDRLVVYLLLTGTAVFSTSEYMQAAQDAANIFFQTPRTLTGALRAATESVNKTLLERNMKSTSRGQYAVGWLVLGALRDSQLTLSMSGPMHAYVYGQNETRHIHEPNVSGKGLGTNQTINNHYTQTQLNAGDRLIFFGRAPSAWDSTLGALTQSSLAALHHRLKSLTSADLNAVLIQASDGSGNLNLLKADVQSKADVKLETPAPADLSPKQTVQHETLPTPEEDPAPALDAHLVQASAYTIPPQKEEIIAAEEGRANPSKDQPRVTAPRAFPASIPRAQAPKQPAAIESEFEGLEPSTEVELPVLEKIVEPVRTRQPRTRREPPAWTRQTAKLAANGIQSTRRLNTNLGNRLMNFLPRLLPGNEDGQTNAPSTTIMMFMAILIPLMVVTIASVVYLRYGRSQQYETYLAQANEMKNQALALTDPVEQRNAWENVINSVNIAESHRETSDTITLRQEADTNLDRLLGITRLQFNPAFSSRIGIDISRMAANEVDLYLLNAVNGEVLRAVPVKSGHGFEVDTKFNCKPGVYDRVTVGPLVDILALPNLNSINATVLGVDATGNLLYCAPEQVAQAIPLPIPDTNWGRVTAFVLDAGNLYVLDAPARAVWVYTGEDTAFIDQPYFFFGGQTPEKQDVIDLVVSGDNLYMLHADGHLSTCSYSRILSVSTRCQDPTPYINTFPAYGDNDLFAGTNFTQLLFTALPDQSILLLNADATQTQGVFRFTPRSLELQNQFRPTTGNANPIPSGQPIGAITVGTNHVLYLAVDGQVYFANDMP